MTPVTEKRLLQVCVAAACCVPVAAGLLGTVRGTPFPGQAGHDLDSHFRYLSGLLLAIGIGFLSTLPQIEKHAQRFRLLTAIVVTGGLARLLGFIMAGVPGPGMILALGMELVVTPCLCLWQQRIARRCS